MGYFNGFSDLLAMGGHGAYVWTAYGLTLLILLWLVLDPVLRQRRLLRQLQRSRRRVANAGVVSVSRSEQQ